MLCMWYEAYDRRLRMCVMGNLSGRTAGFGGKLRFYPQQWSASNSLKHRNFNLKRKLKYNGYVMITSDCVDSSDCGNEKLLHSPHSPSPPSPPSPPPPPHTHTHLPLPPQSSTLPPHSISSSLPCPLPHKYRLFAYLITMRGTRKFQNANTFAAHKSRWIRTTGQKYGDAIELRHFIPHSLCDHNSPAFIWGWVDVCFNLKTQHELLLKFLATAHFRHGKPTTSLPGKPTEII